MTIENECDVYVMAYAVAALHDVDDLSVELEKWMKENPCELDGIAELYDCVEFLRIARQGLKGFIDSFDGICGHDLDEWLHLVKEVRNG